MYGLMSLTARSGRLLQYDYVAADPGFLEQDLARYRAVTAESIRDALRGLGAHRVRLIVHPRKHKEASR